MLSKTSKHFASNWWRDAEIKVDFISKSCLKFFWAPTLLQQKRKLVNFIASTAQWSKGVTKPIFTFRRLGTFSNILIAVMYDIFGFWWKKRHNKNLESSLFEKKMDYCFIKSIFSSTSLENARVSTRMPYGSKWIFIHKK